MNHTGEVVAHGTAVPTHFTVGGPLFRIMEHLIRLTHFLEVLGGVSLLGDVGMIFAGKLPGTPF